MMKNGKLNYCYICSDKGTFRSFNEDVALFNDYAGESDAKRVEKEFRLTDGWNFLGVLDGMGGTRSGGMASSLAADEFAQVIDKITGCDKEAGADDIIREAFLSANNSIIRNARGSGTTATMLGTDGGRAKVYHLGDSRALLIRDGSIVQLTKDQTVEEMKKSMGLYDSLIESDKHRLTEFLGADESMNALRPLETEWIPITGKESLILCTDGLYEGADLCDFLKVAENTKPENVASTLVDLALSRGVRDNITCMYVC